MNRPRDVLQIDVSRRDGITYLQKDEQQKGICIAVQRFQRALEKKHLEQKYMETLELLQKAQKAYNKKLAEEASKRPPLNVTMCAPVDKMIEQERQTEMEVLAEKALKSKEHAIEDLDGYCDDIEEQFKTKNPTERFESSSSTDSSYSSLLKPDSLLEEYLRGKRSKICDNNEATSNQPSAFSGFSSKTQIDPKLFSHLNSSKVRMFTSPAAGFRKQFNSKCTQTDELNNQMRFHSPEKLWGNGNFAAGHEVTRESHQLKYNIGDLQGVFKWVPFSPMALKESVAVQVKPNVSVRSTQTETRQNSRVSFSDAAVDFKMNAVHRPMNHQNFANDYNINLQSLASSISPVKNSLPSPKVNFRVSNSAECVGINSASWSKAHYNPPLDYAEFPAKNATKGGTDASELILGQLNHRRTQSDLQVALMNNRLQSIKEQVSLTFPSQRSSDYYYQKKLSESEKSLLILKSYVRAMNLHRPALQNSESVGQSSQNLSDANISYDDSRKDDTSLFVNLSFVDSSEKQKPLEINETIIEKFKTQDKVSDLFSENDPFVYHDLSTIEEVESEQSSSYHDLCKNDFDDSKNKKLFVGNISNPQQIEIPNIFQTDLREQPYQSTSSDDLKSYFINFKNDNQQLEYGIRLHSNLQSSSVKPASSSVSGVHFERSENFKAVHCDKKEGRESALLYCRSLSNEKSRCVESNTDMQASSTFDVLLKDKKMRLSTEQPVKSQSSPERHDTGLSVETEEKIHEKANKMPIVTQFGSEAPVHSSRNKNDLSEKRTGGNILIDEADKMIREMSLKKLYSHSSICASDTTSYASSTSQSHISRQPLKSDFKLHERNILDKNDQTLVEISSESSFQPLSLVFDVDSVDSSSVKIPSKSASAMLHLHREKMACSSSKEKHEDLSSVKSQVTYGLIMGNKSSSSESFKPLSLIWDESKSSSGTSSDTQLDLNQKKVCPQFSQTEKIIQTTDSSLDISAVSDHIPISLSKTVLGREPKTSLSITSDGSLSFSGSKIHQSTPIKPIHPSLVKKTCISDDLKLIGSGSTTSSKSSSIEGVTGVEKKPFPSLADTEESTAETNTKMSESLESFLQHEQSCHK